VGAFLNDAFLDFIESRVGNDLRIVTQRIGPTTDRFLGQLVKSFESKKRDSMNNILRRKTCAPYPWFGRPITERH